MASLNSLMTDVMTITNRADLIAETKLAVKQATLKMHQVDYFPKDIFETGIAWNPKPLFSLSHIETLFSLAHLSLPA